MSKNTVVESDDDGDLTMWKVSQHISFDCISYISCRSQQLPGMEYICLTVYPLLNAFSICLMFLHCIIYLYSPIYKLTCLRSTYHSHICTSLHITIAILYMLSHSLMTKPSVLKFSLWSLCFSTLCLHIAEILCLSFEIWCKLQSLMPFISTVLNKWWKWPRKELQQLLYKFLTAADNQEHLTAAWTCTSMPTSTRMQHNCKWVWMHWTWQCRVQTGVMQLCMNVNRCERKWTGVNICEQVWTYMNRCERMWNSCP